MSRLSAVRGTARPGDLFQIKPDMMRLFLPLVDAVLRNPAELSAADRELLGTYVSALNNCDFCKTSHAHVAQALGVDPALTRSAEQGQLPNVDAKLRAAFVFAEMANRDAPALTSQDFQVMEKAGFSDSGIFDVLAVVALFRFINTIMSGAGITAASQDAARKEAQFLKHSYLPQT